MKDIEPIISIIMPVFNSGAYLRDAVNSVLSQESIGETSLPPYEIILVDDNSSDPATLAELESLAALTNVVIIKNQRTKGAAGARNSGIDIARGSWIGFLDSDDLWLPWALAIRWQLITNQPVVRWVGAKFLLLKPFSDGSERFESARNLVATARIRNAAEPTRAPLQLTTPVAEFGSECVLGIMTVLIEKTLILEKGAFNETLPRSEDYHLWFKCAFDTDLWIVQCDIALYRIHRQSLTHGDAPRFLHEDKMIASLLASSEGARHAEIFRKRLDLVIQDHCYFYRRQKKYLQARNFAIAWIKSRPLNFSAWKELVACLLCVG